MAAIILPLSDATRFAHLPEIAHKVLHGMKVNQAYVDALDIKITIGTATVPAHSIEYHQSGTILARVTFRGPRNAYYSGKIYRDAPTEVYYNKSGVDTNNRLGHVAGLK